MNERIESHLLATPIQLNMLMPVLRGENVQPYVQQLRWTFSEPVQKEPFQNAWEIVLRRHEVFYYRFENHGLHSLQIRKTRKLQVTFSSEDWTSLNLADAKKQLVNYLKADFQKGFASLDAPLCRFSLLSLSKTVAELVWTSHHSLFDGRGRLSLIEEFLEVYSALVKGKKYYLQKPKPYSEFLRWYQDQDWKASQVFWKKHLKELEASTPLSFGLDTAPRKSRKPAHLNKRIKFEAQLSDKLHQWSKENGFSLNLLLQVAWAIYLSRTADRNTVVFGAPRACRKSSISNADRVVGVFINTVPVKVTVTDSDSIRDLLKRTRDYWLEIREHENTPYEIMRAASSLSEGEVLFSSLVGYEKYQLDNFLNSNCRTNYQIKLNAFTEIPIVIQLKDGERLGLEIAYDKARFNSDCIKGISTSLELIFHQIVENSDSLIRSVDLLNPDTKNSIIKMGTGNQVNLEPRTVFERFEDCANKFPQNIAISFKGRPWTYEFLNSKANQLARLLTSRGLLKGDRVGIFLPRGPEIIVSQLAIMKAGGVYVPCDTDLPEKRIDWITQHARLSFVISDSTIRNQRFNSDIEIVRLDTEEKKLKRYAKKNVNCSLDWTETAYLMYTSGSTGHPKGVLIPHRGIVRLATGQDYTKLASSIKTLQIAAFTFDLSTFAIWTPLLNGGTCVISVEQVPSVEDLKHLIESESINTVMLTTTVFNSVIDTYPQVFDSLDQLMVGAETLSTFHIKKAQRLFPKLKLINVYGPTENTTLSTSYQIPKTHNKNASVPIGHPINNSSAYVLDKQGRILPPGVPGELYVGGLGLSSGYFDNEELTKSRFIPVTTIGSTKETLYKTGDRAYLRQNGQIEFLDRIDDQVKIRGYRIELGEIQSQLLQQKEVLDVIVLTKQNRRKEFEIVAFIVVDERFEKNPDTLKRRLATTLPRYMIPSHFVFLHSIPLTPNGKFDRSALERIKIEDKEVIPIRKATLSSTERKLLDLWAEILGDAPTSIDQDFFEAGGHSLLATNLIFRIQKFFSLHLSFSNFQVHSNIRDLSSWIENHKKAHFQTLESDPFIISHEKPETSGPLGLKWRSFCIPDILHPEKVRSLLICRLVVLDGNLRKDLLRKAIAHVVNTHERLRTYGAVKDEQLLEIIEPHVSLDIPLIDHSRYPLKSALARARMVFEKDCINNLSMRVAPMIDVKLIKVNEQKHVLSLVIQHAVADGHSVEMLYRQTSDAYNELLEDKPISLKKPKLSYRQYEKSLEKWLNKGHENRIKNFWKKQLRGLKPIPYPFLLKRLPAHIQWNVFDHYDFTPQWTKRILTFTKEHKITPFLFFTTVIKMMIGRYTNEMDSYALTALDNRSGKEQKEIFGDFSNTVILRNRLRKTRTFLEQAKVERQTLFSAIDHKYISVNGIDSPHQEQVEHAFSPFGQLQIMHGPDSEESFQLKGIKSSFVPRRRLGSTTRLGFIIRESKYRMQITFVYAPDIFIAHGIERLKHNFQTIVKQVIVNPLTTLNDLPELDNARNYRNKLSGRELSQSILVPKEYK